MRSLRKVVEDLDYKVNVAAYECMRWSDISLQIVQHVINERGLSIENLQQQFPYLDRIDGDCFHVNRARTSGEYVPDYRREIPEEDTEMQEDGLGNQLQTIEKELEDPKLLDEMIKEGNKVQKGYKKEIVAAKKAEALKAKEADMEQE